MQPRPLAVAVLFLSICALGQNPDVKPSGQSTQGLNQSYVEMVSEFTSRSRANVYFVNPQSIFDGVQVNFVNVGKGNLTFLRRDMVTSGHIPLVLARVYDSSSAGSAEFGPGWLLSAAETISIQDDVVRLRSESGAIIEFVAAGANAFVLRRDHPSDYAQLLRKSSDTIEARLHTGFVKEYLLIKNLYRLIKVTDHNGNQVRITYTTQGMIAKLENESHFIEFTRNHLESIIRAQDDQGRQVQFLYNTRNQLVEADDLGGHRWKYQYTDDGRLKSAFDPLEKLNFGISYDEAMRVRRLQLPSGVIQYNYNPELRSSIVIDRKQLVSRFFQNEEGITVRVVNALGEETNINLDAARNVTSLARNGDTTQSMKYDGQHRLLTRQSLTASGIVGTQYKYDLPTGLLAKIDSSDGASQVFGYDARGNLSNATTDTGLHRYGFSQSGDLVKYSTADIKVSFTPTFDGLIASMSEGPAPATSFLYREGGELSEVRFADGSHAKYDYQPSGLRAKLAYQDGRHVEYGYDPAGNLAFTKIFDAKGNQIAGQKLELNDSYELVKWAPFHDVEQSFDYDPNGNLHSLSEGRFYHPL